MNLRDYYKKFGWRGDPFTIRLDEDDYPPVLTRKKEYNEVVNLITGGKNVFMFFGEGGIGKTTFVQELEANPPPSIDVLLSYDWFESPQAVIDDISKKLSKYLWWTIKRSPAKFGRGLSDRFGKKKILLLFDEVQEYKDDDLGWFKTFDKCRNVYLIFLGTEAGKSKIQSQGTLSRRVFDYIPFSDFSPKELSDLIEDRITWRGGKPPAPFKDRETLLELSKASWGTPGRLMELAGKAVKKAAEEEIMEIDVSILGELLEEVRVNEPKPTKTRVEGGYSDTSLLAMFSPLQQKIIELLMSRGALTMKEIAENVGISLPSANTQVARLRGKDEKEKKRRPDAPWPIIILGGTEERDGRKKNVYTLSNVVRMRLAKK